MTASGSINEELHAIDAPKIWLTRLFQPGTAANQSSANQISPSAAIKSKSLADQAFPNHAFLVGTIPHGKSRDSQESLRVLALRHGINPKTVAKWKKRRSVEDRRTGPREPRSTVLSIEDEAVIVAFRRHTLLPLDDCLYALQATIPHLTRSSLHRCLQRHGISRLPEVDGEKPTRKTFKSYPIGYFHIDLAEVRTAAGKLYLYVAIDRTSKFAYVEVADRANTMTAAAFVDALAEAVPYDIHTILTDNGIQFATLPKNRDGL